MSTQDLAFDEMNSPYRVTKNERLDLMPEPGTVRFSHLGAGSVIRSRSSEDLATTAGIDFAWARFTVSLYRSLLPLVATSSAAVASLYASRMIPVLARLAQEWQSNECSRIKALTQCLPLFKNTMKTVNPSLLKQGIVIHPEVREDMKSDEQLRRIIDASVIELSNALEDEDSYYLDVFEETDADVPRWNENVIRVRIGTVNFENKIKLWERLEERVRSKIEEIRKQFPPNKRKKVDTLNESLSIRLETEDL